MPHVFVSKKDDKCDKKPLELDFNMEYDDKKTVEKKKEKRWFRKIFTVKTCLLTLIGLFILCGLVHCWAATQVIGDIARNLGIIKGIAHEFYYFDLKSNCPSYHWQHVGPAGDLTSCYLITEKAMTFEDSQDYCKERGGDLVSLETEHEKKFLLDINRNSEDFKNPTFTDPYITEREYWIGATDLVENGRWIWIASGRAISSAIWDPILENPGTKRCAALIAGRHQWKSENQKNSWSFKKCETKLPAICEHSFDKKADSSFGNEKKWCSSNSSRSCYMLNQNLQTSVTSEKMCKENGGHLAMIDSKQEEADILKILEIHGSENKKTNDIEAFKTDMPVEEDVIFDLFHTRKRRSTPNKHLYRSPLGQLGEDMQFRSQKKTNNVMHWHISYDGLWDLSARLKNYTFDEKCMVFGPNGKKFDKSGNHWFNVPCDFLLPSICEIPNPAHASKMEELINLTYLPQDPICDLENDFCIYPWLVQATYDEATAFCRNQFNGSLLSFNVPGTNVTMEKLEKLLHVKDFLKHFKFWTSGSFASKTKWRPYYGFDTKFVWRTFEGGVEIEREVEMELAIDDYYGGTSWKNWMTGIHTIKEDIWPMHQANTGSRPAESCIYLQLEGSDKKWQGISSGMASSTLKVMPCSSWQASLCMFKKKT